MFALAVGRRPQTVSMQMSISLSLPTACVQPSVAAPSEAAIGASILHGGVAGKRALRCYQSAPVGLMSPVTTAAGQIDEPCTDHSAHPETCTVRGASEMFGELSAMYMHPAVFQLGKQKDSGNELSKAACEHVCKLLNTALFDHKASILKQLQVITSEFATLSSLRGEADRLHNGMLAVQGRLEGLALLTQPQCSPTRSIQLSISYSLNTMDYSWKVCVPHRSCRAAA